MDKIERNVRTSFVASAIADLIYLLVQPDRDNDECVLELMDWVLALDVDELEESDIDVILTKIVREIQRDEDRPPSKEAPKQRSVMNDNEAIVFERRPIPEGRSKKYAGELVINVPPSYWIAYTENDWNRELLRYMGSRRFQDRQDEGE